MTCKGSVTQIPSDLCGHSLEKGYLAMWKRIWAIFMNESTICVADLQLRQQEQAYQFQALLRDISHITQQQAQVCHRVDTWCAAAANPRPAPTRVNVQLCSSSSLLSAPPDLLLYNTWNGLWRKKTFGCKPCTSIRVHWPHWVFW